MAQAVLLDIAGVLSQGEEALPGAAEAVARLRSAGLDLRFLTNSTRTPRRGLIERLAGLGIEVSDTDLFTPARAACDLLRRRGHRPHLLIHPDLAEDFADLPACGSGTAVIVGDAGRHFTYDALNAAFRQLMDGAGFLALAANRRFRDADGHPSMDAGAFVAALEYASGREAEVLGKPAEAFFAAALADIGCPAADAAMIGDDAEADIAGALRAGLGEAVLVRTGKYRPGDETAISPRPTRIVADIREAVDGLLAG